MSKRQTEQDKLLEAARLTVSESDDQSRAGKIDALVRQLDVSKYKAGKLLGELKAPAKTKAKAPRKITTKLLNTVRPELEAALGKVLSKYGLRGDLGSISYSEDMFRCKLTAEADAVDEAGLDVAAKRTWDLYCFRSGLEESDFGREFTTHKGEAFTISAYNPRARKNPISAIRKSNGETYVFTGLAISRYLSAAAGS